MIHSSLFRFGFLVAFNALLWCLWGLFGTTVAAPPKGPQPMFPNPQVKRDEIVQELQQINALLVEQNALLRSGQMKVIVVEQ